MKYLLILTLFTNIAFGNPGLSSIFTKVSKKYSVSHTLLSRIAYIESNFDTKAKSKYSSARGLFQIINSTEIWLRELCFIEGDIFDPEVNTELGACYIQHNTRYLRKKLKRDITDLDLYLAHFFGAYTAFRFLSLKDTDLGYKAFKTESKANRNVFFHKDGTPKTVKEIKDYFKQKLEEAVVL